MLATDEEGVADELVANFESVLVVAGAVVREARAVESTGDEAVLLLLDVERMTLDDESVESVSRASVALSALLFCALLARAVAFCLE